MDKPKNIELVADIVGAFVGNNSVTVSDLPALIRSVYDALDGVGQPVAAATSDITKPTPSQIRKSITDDHLVSFEDGKHYKTLKRHLTTLGMTVADYKAKWGLPNDYPSTASSYSAARSALAKSLGLGQGGRGRKPAPKPAAPAAKGRAKKA